MVGREKVLSVVLVVVVLVELVVLDVVSLVVVVLVVVLLVVPDNTSRGSFPHASDNGLLLGSPP